MQQALFADQMQRKMYLFPQKIKTYRTSKKEEILWK